MSVYIKLLPYSNLFFKDQQEIKHFHTRIRDTLGDFQCISQETIIYGIISCLQQREIESLALTSTSYYVLCNYQPFWRQTFFNLAETCTGKQLAFNFKGCWKQLVKQNSTQGYHIEQEHKEAQSVSQLHTTDETKQDKVSGRKILFYSDTLYRPFLYRFSDVEQKVLCHVLPGAEPAATCEETSWLSNSGQVSQVREVEESSLSVEDFVATYEAKSVPVKIRAATQRTWPVFERWQPSEALCKKATMFSEVDGLPAGQPNLGQLAAQQDASTLMSTVVRAGQLNLTLKDFLTYCEHCEQEENKLYLFDCTLLENQAYPHFCGLFSVPKYFEASRTRDLFHVMGDKRPDYRWIIAGAGESCSKWHIDPNFTHAWNAVVSGSKLWLLLPFDCVPCGVYPSEDLTEVTQPVSLAEWFHLYFEATVETWGEKLFMTIAKPSEVVFIPSRWWHCVVNLEPTVAITQNYLALSNLKKALRMMKFNPELVSGIDKHRAKEALYPEFVQALTASNVAAPVHTIVSEIEAEAAVCSATSLNRFPCKTKQSGSAALRSSKKPKPAAQSDPDVQTKETKEFSFSFF